MFGVPTNHLGPGNSVIGNSIAFGEEANEELLSKPHERERSDSYLIDLTKLCNGNGEERAIKQV